MEWFLLTYSYVGLSEYGHIGEALMRALDATISASFEDSGMGGVNNSKKNKSAGKCIVRAWNRIYSRFLRFLSGSVSEPGEIPSIQRRLAAPQVLETPQSEHSYRHGRSRSNSQAFPGPQPDSPSHSLLSSAPSLDSLGSLVSAPPYESVNRTSSQGRLLRFLSGPVSASGEIPNIQQQVVSPRRVLEKPQFEHSYRHGRSRSSNYLAISGPKPDSPSHSLLSSPPSTDSLGSLGSSNSLVYVSTPKSVDWVHSQRRVLDSKERKANATRCKAHSLI
ncbi:hypothetical protein B484DRAFT_457992 [Ochromonadaceae sp. CCMP2298]|nr:hypothetical protein B484DRAFT_457992 [Ochromonadaceae sp. CCMP2298]